MSYQTKERECLYCGDPIEGRADKQFCSNACKARYNREQQEAASPSISLGRPATPLLPTQRRIGLVEHNEDDEEDDSLEAYEREQLQIRNREKAQQLHELYTQILVRFLKREGETLPWKTLDRFMKELDEVIDDYHKHPSLRLAQHPSHNRIKDLYLMRDYLREVGELMADADQAVKSIFGKSVSEPVYMRLSKKHRNRLQDNSLGEE